MTAAARALHSLAKRAAQSPADTVPEGQVPAALRPFLAAIGSPGATAAAAAVIKEECEAAHWADLAMARAEAIHR